MTPATPITEALEALMPEPTATVDADGYLVVLLGGYIPTHAKLYTADQMREAIRAATERAARLCEEQGDFYLATHNRQAEQATDACAAAIRASSGKGASDAHVAAINAQAGVDQT